MKTGIHLIAEERQEQIEKHKRSINADAIHNSSEQLKEGAIKLLDDPQDYRIASRPINWNKPQWDYMCSKPYKERLIIAGALIAAEIDRVIKNKNGYKK